MCVKIVTRIRVTLLKPYLLFFLHFPVLALVIIMVSNLIVIIGVAFTPQRRIHMALVTLTEESEREIDLIIVVLVKCSINTH